MGKRKDKYPGYRRQRRRGSVALEIIIVLLLLILIAFLLFSKVLGGTVRLVDGKLQVTLPSAGQVQEEPIPSEEVSLPPLIIEEPDETPSPEPEPEPLPALTVAVEVTVEQLLDGSAAQTVRDGGGNALVVTMKPFSGIPAWGEEEPEVEEAVRALAAADELHLVARVCCFRDQALAAEQVGGPLQTKGGNIWYDRFGQRWVSPASEQVRRHLEELCVRLADMGFDELLLEYACYPYFGETHVLATDELRPEDLTGPVQTFWRELREAMGRREVLISALVTEGLLTGEKAESGMTTALLAACADRVWIAPSECDPAALLTGAGMEDAGQRLVWIGSTETEGSRGEISPTIAS